MTTDEFVVVVFLTTGLLLSLIFEGALVVFLVDYSYDGLIMGYLDPDTVPLACTGAFLTTFRAVFWLFTYPPVF